MQAKEAAGSRNKNYCRQKQPQYLCCSKRQQQLRSRASGAGPGVVSASLPPCLLLPIEWLQPQTWWWGGDTTLLLVEPKNGAAQCRATANWSHLMLAFLAHLGFLAQKGAQSAAKQPLGHLMLAFCQLFPTLPSPARPFAGEQEKVLADLHQLY